MILEDLVYGNPWINRSVETFLRERGIPLTFTDHERYTFTHAKFWIIDDRYCVSTGNWTKSMFRKNREYIVCGDDPEMQGILVEIFDADFHHRAFVDMSHIPPYIALSPP